MSTQPRRPISRQPISAAWTFGMTPLTISPTTSARTASAWGALLGGRQDLVQLGRRVQHDQIGAFALESLDVRPEADQEQRVADLQLLLEQAVADAPTGRAAGRSPSGRSPRGPAPRARSGRSASTRPGRWPRPCRGPATRSVRYRPPAASGMVSSAILLRAAPRSRRPACPHVEEQDVAGLRARSAPSGGWSASAAVCGARSPAG